MRDFEQVNWSLISRRSLERVSGFLKAWDWIMSMNYPCLPWGGLWCLWGRQREEPGGVQDKVPLFPRLECGGVKLWCLFHLLQVPLPLEHWLEFHLVSNLSWFFYADAFCTSIFLAITFLAAYSLNESPVKMLQKRKGFFPLFPFFPLGRLDLVQLHWKRRQLWKLVQI